MDDQKRRRTPLSMFALLHVCTAWPVGVISFAVGNRLSKLGVPVEQTATMISAVYLAFSLEFVWAPLVDSSLTRKRWYIAGTLLMCVSLAALIMAPWSTHGMFALEALAFIACSGAALADTAIKGLMAYEVPAARLGSASGYYTAGGYFAKTIGAALTLWMLVHMSSRAFAGVLSSIAAAVAGTAILLTSRTKPVPMRTCATALRATLIDVWRFIRTRRGAVIAVLCVVPFGSGTEAGLIGAIAGRWHVGADALGAWIVLSAVGTISGAMVVGWLAVRISAWKTYLAVGWAMVAVVVALALAPRVPAAFLIIEFAYRALTGASLAAVLALVMNAIGRGAASSKASIMWSLYNLAAVLPTMIEGHVQTHAGTTAMLMTFAVLSMAGLGLLLLTTRLLAFRFGQPESVSDLCDPA